MNKMQELFDKLVKEYDLRAIEIERETWYILNDLPLSKQTISNTITRLEETDKEFVNSNKKLLTNSEYISSVRRNFDKVNNAGETIGNFKMVNYLIMNSRLGSRYKIKLIEILDQIRINDYYVDENITDKNLDKLQEEINRLRGLIVVGNGGFENHQYKALSITAKEWSKIRGIEITEQMLLALMKKVGYITKDNNINHNMAYGNKIIVRNDIYYLSPKCLNLLVKQLDKYNNEELIQWNKKYIEESKPF